MAFCPSCGSQVDGKFCAKCGTAVTAAPTGVVNPPTPAQPSAAGLDQNVASALCYLLFCILGGILFLVLEPYNKNKTIRFHAFQAIFFWLGFVALYIVVGILSTLLAAISFLGFWSVSFLLFRVLELGFLVVWVMLIYKAYNNEKWVLPIIGPLAEKQA